MRIEWWSECAVVVALFAAVVAAPVALHWRGLTGCFNFARELVRRGDSLDSGWGFHAGGVCVGGIGIGCLAWWVYVPGL